MEYYRRLPVSRWPVAGACRVPGVLGWAGRIARPTVAMEGTSSARILAQFRPHFHARIRHPTPTLTMAWVPSAPSTVSTTLARALTFGSLCFLIYLCDDFWCDWVPYLCDTPLK